MKKNILMIMADQLTPFLLKIYGDRTCRTPNIDKLAAKGVVFDGAYSPCPLCAPARAGMMAGRMPSDIGCYDNASVLPSSEPTLAHCMSLAGYETVLSGKMHFIGPDQFHGFEKRLNTDIYPANLLWIPFIRDEKMLGGGEHAKNYVPGNYGVRPWSVGLQYDEETVFHAVHYLRERWLEKNERGRTSRPFFLCVSMHHPHEPFYVTPGLWDMYKDADVGIPVCPDGMPVSVMDQWLNEQYHRTDKYRVDDPENLRNLRRCYYALTSYVDGKVGELISALEQTGELENTTVIFTSDHGDMLADRGMVQKRCFYEWSARIPMIIANAPGAKPGTRDDRPASLLDLLPTLADIGGYDGPRGDAEGSSLLREAPPETAVYSENHSEGVRAPCFMIREGKFKLVYIHGYDGQLFNLENDPSEMRDLFRVPEYDEIRKRLTARILKRFDPEKISKIMGEDWQKRRMIRDADNITGLKHDYCPRTDGSKLYYRGDTTIADVKIE